MRLSSAIARMRVNSQAGFTLVELLIATALGLLVIGAITSVVLTSVIADNTASARVEASAQVRNFQATAVDDFDLARAPVPSGCGTPSSPCTTQDLVLQGLKFPNAIGGVAAPYTVRYAWDSVQEAVTRYVGTSGRVTASNVTAYSWYVDSSGGHPTVVINMTVTVRTYNATYSESQTFRFYPRVSP